VRSVYYKALPELDGMNVIAGGISTTKRGFAQYCLILNYYEEYLPQANTGYIRPYYEILPD
jgi:hypothetical protein